MLAYSTGNVMLRKVERSHPLPSVSQSKAPPYTHSLVFRSTLQANLSQFAVSLSFPIHAQINRQATCHSHQRVSNSPNDWPAASRTSRLSVFNCAGRTGGQTVCMGALRVCPQTGVWMSVCCYFYAISQCVVAYFIMWWNSPIQFREYQGTDECACCSWES
jgi:hypothetical protein